MAEDKKENKIKEEEKKDKKSFNDVMAKDNRDVKKKEKPVSDTAKKENKDDKKKEELIVKDDFGRLNKVDGLEELPEEIKKKLEKKKSEKSTKVQKGKARKKKKKEIKKVSVGKAFIKATYNNTIITLTDLTGNVISWASAGIVGFKGPKKSTPYAAQIITRLAVEKAREVGLSEVSVFVQGVGTGRESAVRALNANGLVVTSIKDITPLPHNGCRRRKPRRV
jgi:small subunit ribosomal protein S11